MGLLEACFFVPQPDVAIMLDHGHEKCFAMGSITSVGGIDMLILPTALTVLLGSLAAFRPPACC